MRNHCKQIINTFEANQNPTEKMKQISKEYRKLFKDITEQIHKNVCNSEDKYKAIEKLEEALFWLNKAIFHYDFLDDEK